MFPHFWKEIFSWCMLGWELHSIFRTNCNGPENNTTKEQYHTWCLKWVGKKTLQTQRANSFEGNCFLGLSSSVGYSSILQFCFPYFCNISKIMFQFLVKLRYFLLSFFPQLTKILIIILWINLLFCTEVYRTDSEVCLLTFFFFFFYKFCIQKITFKYKNDSCILNDLSV